MKKSFLIVVFIGMLFSITNCFAQYQAGDTIEIKTSTYEEQIIEAEWNATNETSVAGKNVPTELDGRIVIGDTKSGSLLGYPIYVGEGGGSFLISIDYKGFPGGQFAGYMELNFDDGAVEKINMVTEGWVVATSQVYQLSPGFHILYTRYKGSSQSFYIDKFRLKALPGTLQEKPIRQLSALTYTPELIEIEDFDEDKSSMTDGKNAIEGDAPTYVTNIQDGDTLTYPVRVGSGGGQYDVSYRYKKLTNDTASIHFCKDDSVIYALDLPGTASSEWISVSMPTPVALSPGYQKIKLFLWDQERIKLIIWN